MRSASVLIALLLLWGCSGSLSPTLNTSRLAPVAGGTLLVYVSGSPRLQHADTLAASLGDTLDASFHRLLERRLSERVAFDQIRVERMPDSLIRESQRFNVIRRPGMRDLESVRAPASGTVLDVPGAPTHILFLDDVRGRRQSRTSSMPSGGTMHGIVWTLAGDAALWDNRSGSVVTFHRRVTATVSLGSGWELLRRRPTVSVETWEEAVEDLADEVSETMRLATREGFQR